MANRSIWSILFFFGMAFNVEAQRYAVANKFIDSREHRMFHDVMTKGTPLLFKGEWVRGQIVAANNTVIKSDSFLLNFDQLSQSLLVTSNYDNIVEIDRKEYKSVVFFVQDSALQMEHVYYIDNKHLFQVIINGGREKYSLFKLNRTVLRKRELSTGLIYNSYLDVPEYFLLFPDKDYRKIFRLKRSKISKLFSFRPEKQKVDEFLATLGENNLEEAHLTKLVNYLNE